MESSKIKELAQDQQDYVVAMRREFSPFTGAFRKRIPHKRTVDRRNRKNGCSL